MTDRRPPQDVASNTESEPAEDAQADGKRSQTVPLGGSAPLSGAQPPPPRSTFSNAEPSKRQRPASGPVQTAPRSVFKPASAPPIAIDADKAVKRPHPGAWGGTLLVDGAPPPPPAASARPHAQAAAEPLRMPSNRPVPAPYQKRGQNLGTLLMGSDDATPPAASEGQASTSRAAASPSTSQRPAVTAQPTPVRRAGPAKTEASTPVQKNSEPIHLSLDARDQMLEAPASIRADVPRSRAPLIALAAVVAVAVVVIVVMLTRHSSTSADAAQPVDGVRSSAVPAADAPAAVQPAAPTAVVPAQTKTEPAMRAPAEPVHHEPAAAKQPAHDEPAAKHVASKPATKPKREAKEQAQPPPETGEMLDAREALQGLEKTPVVKLKAKEKSSDDLADRAMRDALDHPPAPPATDEPVLKVKPGAGSDNDAPPAP